MTEFLAQFAPNLPTPPHLPSPPLLEHLLLESPLPLVALLVLAALALAWSTRTSTRPRRLRVIAASLLLAGGIALMAISEWIKTDRERMRTAADLLVDAVSHADTAKMNQLLAPDCYFFSRFTIPGYHAGSDGMNKQAILDQVPKTIHDYPIHECETRELQALSRGRGIGTTQILVRVVAEIPNSGYKFPFQSWWKIDWKRDDSGDWRATSIEPLTDPAGGAAQLR